MFFVADAQMFCWQALGLNAQDALTTEMLERALKDAAGSFSGHLLYPQPQ